MIDRASAEITRCIMRIKKKKDGSNNSNNTNSGTSAGSPNNSNTNKAPNSPNLHHHHQHSDKQQQPQQQQQQQHHHNQQGDSNSVTSTPQKKCYNSQMGLGNIIMMGTPTRKLNHCVPGAGSASGVGTYGTSQSPKSKMNFGGNLIMDSIFLGYLFKKYFYGLDKLVLPQVCKYWRDTTYALGKDYWDNEVLPVLNCKEIRHELLNGAGVRRRFYQALHKRGYVLRLLFVYIVV